MSILHKGQVKELIQELNDEIPPVDTWKIIILLLICINIIKRKYYEFFCLHILNIYEIYH